MKAINLASVVVLIATAANSQNAVDISLIHQRVVIISPIVGTGTLDDPRRPLFAPTATLQASALATRASMLSPKTNPSTPITAESFISWRFVESDDGKTAIAEFVARDRKVLLPLLQSVRTDVQIFEIGRVPMATIEAACKKYKKDFNAQAFFGVGR